MQQNKMLQKQLMSQMPGMPSTNPQLFQNNIAPPTSNAQFMAAPAAAATNLSVRLGTGNAPYANWPRPESSNQLLPDPVQRPPMNDRNMQRRDVGRRRDDSRDRRDEPRRNDKKDDRNDNRRDNKKPAVLQPHLYPYGQPSKKTAEPAKTPEKKKKKVEVKKKEEEKPSTNDVVFKPLAKPTLLNKTRRNVVFDKS